VRRSFDRFAVAEALRLQTIVEPCSDGDLTFGHSMRDWVSKAWPGALGVTWLLARDETEKLAIRARAREIIEHFREVPGFIDYVELYYSEVDRPDQHQHLVFAIMPGDPGDPGEGHVINYRVDDVDAIVARMQEDGVETSPVTVGPDAEGQGKFVRLLDPEGQRIELWEHLSDGS
jgi:catechol 2,3-dioxygenase-like lactoylglutathione lyase family enzyme